MLFLIFSCYKDNGESLRTDFNQEIKEGKDNGITSPPCEGDLILNSFSIANYREYFTDIRGLTPGKYLSGYFIYASNLSLDYYFKIELLNRPTIKKNYLTASRNNNSDDECIIYVTNRITNEELFAENLNTIFVDVLANGDIKVSFCDVLLKHQYGSNSLFIQNFSITSPN
jgi:hypothetical protein